MEYQAIDQPSQAQREQGLGGRAQLLIASLLMFALILVSTSTSDPLAMNSSPPTAPIDNTKLFTVASPPTTRGALKPISVSDRASMSTIYTPIKPIQRNRPGRTLETIPVRTDATIHRDLSEFLRQPVPVDYRRPFEPTREDSLGIRPMADSNLVLTRAPEGTNVDLISSRFTIIGSTKIVGDLSNQLRSNIPGCDVTVLSDKAPLTENALEGTLDSRIILIALPNPAEEFMNIASIDTTLPSPPHPEFAQVSANLMRLRDLIPPLVEASPNAIFIVVSEPVHMISYFVQMVGKIPRERVFGVGTFTEHITTTPIFNRVMHDIEEGTQNSVNVVSATMKIIRTIVSGTVSTYVVSSSVEGEYDLPNRRHFMPVPRDVSFAGAFPSPSFSLESPRAEAISIPHWSQLMLFSQWWSAHPPRMEEDDEDAADGHVVASGTLSDDAIAIIRSVTSDSPQSTPTRLRDTPQPTSDGDNNGGGRGRRVNAENGGDNSYGHNNDDQGGGDDTPNDNEGSDAEDAAADTLVDAAVASEASSGNGFFSWLFGGGSHPIDISTSDGGGDDGGDDGGDGGDGGGDGGSD